MSLSRSFVRRAYLVQQMRHQAESIDYWTSNKIGVFDLNYDTGEQYSSSNGRRRHLPERATGSAFRERTLLTFSILEGLFAGVLLAQGFAKLFGSPVMSPLFDQNGMGLWLRYIVGVVEVALAILLLNPRPRFLASFVMRKPDKHSPQLRDDRNQRTLQGDHSHVF